MKNESEQPKTFWRQVTASYVVWALVALIAVDLGCRLASALSIWPVSPYQSAQRSGVWWASIDFKDRLKAPEIALLGSSLMMAAVHGGDATYLKQSQKVAFHHKSTLLEDLLDEKFHKDYSTFSFALGGEMASDAYVLTRTMLRGEKQPKMIIYGIAPRDFMDNAFKSPSSSEIFRYMSRIDDMPDLAIKARQSFWNIVEYGCGKLSFLYEHRPDFLYLQHHSTKALLANIGYKDMEEVRTTFHIRKQAFQELPEDSGPDEVSCHPPDGRKLYEDNLDEYRYRYSAIDEKQFKEQVSYLENLLQLSDERGIKVMLVNMPLTKDNLDLMPQGFYQRYLDRMNELCSTYKAQMIDMNEQDKNQFPKEYFADSVHLNSQGGKHFFEILSDRMLKDSQVASTMRSIVE